MPGWASLLKPQARGHILYYEIHFSAILKHNIIIQDVTPFVLANDLNVQTFDDIFQVLVGITSNVCCKSGQCMSIVGVNPDGKVTPCTRPFNPKYTFGDMTITAISDIERNAAYEEFRTVESAGQAATLSCKWRDLCGNGGCPHDRFVSGKQDPSGHHVYCTCHTGATGGYPRLFEHILSRISSAMTSLPNHIGLMTEKKNKYSLLKKHPN